MLLNLVFTFLAIFHLTYLGSMFDPGLDEQEVEEVDPMFICHVMVILRPCSEAIAAVLHSLVNIKYLPGKGRGYVTEPLDMFLM